MLLKIHWGALCVAPLLSGMSFAAPHLVARQSGNGGFIDQVWDTYNTYRSKLHDWRQQNFPGGKSGPHPEITPSPETVSSPETEFPGESKITPYSQPQNPPAASNSEDIEIIIEAPVECGVPAPFAKMPSTSPWRTPQGCSQIAASKATRQKIFPLDCSNRQNDRARVFEQESAIEFALHSFFPESSDWRAESQFCGVLYYSAPLTPSQITELQGIIYSPTIVPDDPVDAPIKSGAGSMGDAQISPSDTGLPGPSGDIVAPPDQTLQQAGSDSQFPPPEKDHQLKSPSPFPSPVSGKQSDEQKESGQFEDEKSVPNAKIHRLGRRRHADLDAIMMDIKLI